MARKGGKGRGRGRGEDTDDETLSTVSSRETGSMCSSYGEEEAEYKELSQVDGFMDALYEKRGSVRESGLRGLIALLACNMELMSEVLVDKYETLVGRFVNCVKKGGASEVALACRALGLLALTAAAEGSLGLELLLEECFPPLLKLVKGNSVAGLECMAVVSFIGICTGDLDVEASALGSVDVAEGGVIGMVWQVASGKGSVTVKAAAVAAWNLLFTTLPSHRVAHYVKLTLPPLCAVLIDAEDLAVRKAAGEAVGLLFEAAALPEGVARGGASEDSDYEAAWAARGNAFCGLMHEMKALMVSLSDVESKSRQSKKERLAKVNTSSFRSFLGSIEDGCECRETVVKLNQGDVLRISTWAQTVQLNYLRKYLAEGFQKHMQENPLLHYIFDYVPRERETPGMEMDKRERRLHSSFVSKGRTRRMNHLRSVKTEYLAGW